MAERNSRRFQAVVIVFTLAIATVSLLYFSLNPLESRNSNPDSSGITCTSYHTTFLITANSRGYNDSIHHGVPKNYWPILCAHKGDTITITVENTGNEPHGFAIGHYYEGGVSLGEGRNLTITFVADQSGAFSIFCTILCSVHPWMLSGVLVIR